MIQVENISKSFNKKPVLKKITTSFIAGKTNLIIGASGSGKTTLLKCMVGLHSPDSGSINFNGRNFHNLPNKDQRRLRQEIGMLFQGGALFDYLTVGENVMFPLIMSEKMSLKEMTKRVEFCLNRVDLKGAHDLFPSELSGGMQKRVAIARAISLNPKYLFCDEPNSGLDPTTATVIDNLLKEITYENNITTVINTHDMNSVMDIGDNIVFIKEGEKKWEGDKTNFLSSKNKDLCEFKSSSKLLV